MPPQITKQAALTTTFTPRYTTLRSGRSTLVVYEGSPTPPPRSSTSRGLAHSASKWCVRHWYRGVHLCVSACTGRSTNLVSVSIFGLIHISDISSLIAGRRSSSTEFASRSTNAAIVSRQPKPDRPHPRRTVLALLPRQQGCVLAHIHRREPRGATVQLHVRGCYEFRTTPRCARHVMQQAQKRKAPKSQPAALERNKKPRQKPAAAKITVPRGQQLPAAAVRAAAVCLVHALGWLLPC